MNKPELQDKILANTQTMFRLASAISRLPESETKGELIYKHDKVAERLASQQALLEELDNTCCYFGFTDRCPGMVCCDCEYLPSGGESDGYD